MSLALTFDTFKYVERLEKAGASRELAAALVEAQRDSFSEALDTQIATKGDIAEIKSEIFKLMGEMANIRWMMGMLIALAVANFAKQYF